VVFSDAIFCMSGILHDRLLRRDPSIVGRCSARRGEVGVELGRSCDMKPSANVSMSKFELDSKWSVCNSHKNHNSCTRHLEIYSDLQGPIAYSVAEWHLSRHKVSRETSLSIGE
jgi:hypothetical protein